MIAKFYFEILAFLIVIFIFVMCMNLLKKKIIHNNYIHSSLSKIDKMNGYEFEEYLFHLFKESGYKVKRTPKSGDYGVDLVLINPDNKEKIAVQAKRYKKKVGVSAIQQVVGGMKYYGCEEAIVVTNSFFTQPAIDLALINGVELIDRNNINEFIKSWK